MKTHIFHCNVWQHKYKEKDELVCNAIIVLWPKLHIFVVYSIFQNIMLIITSWNLGIDNDFFSSKMILSRNCKCFVCDDSNILVDFDEEVSANKVWIWICCHNYNNLG